MKKSRPLKLASGVYVTVSGLASLTVAEPFDGHVPMATVRSALAVSTSSSLAVTSMVTAVSSSVVLVSSTATRASFTALTVTVTVPVWSRSPSGSFTV